MEQALIVIKPQQQRPRDLFAFVVAKAPNDAVGAANALDFLHPIARSRQILKVAAFCDDTIETAAALLEPAPGIGDVRCHRRQPEHAMPAELLPGEGLARFRRSASGRSAACCTAAVHQHVEGDERRRRLLRQQQDPAVRRMDALQEIIERQTVPDRNNELTVKHEAIGRQFLAAATTSGG